MAKKLTVDKIIEGIGNGDLNSYNDTLTKEHRATLIKAGYWWLKYDGVDPKVAPAGHLVATGACQMGSTKRCKGYSEHIYTSHYGCDVVPCCHTCWSTIGVD